MPITALLEAWLKKAPAPARLGEVVILPGYELRHYADQTQSPEKLSPVADLIALREIVKSDAQGNFRPVRGAPTLRAGWRMGLLSIEELIAALNLIYPSAVPFWAAQEEGMLRVTEFKETAARQTGMYRITQIITPAQFTETVAAVCEKGCLRRRLWQPATEKPLAKEELPLLCAEACNYFVSQTRERIVADRKKENS